MFLLLVVMVGGVLTGYVCGVDTFDLKWHVGCFEPTRCMCIPALMVGFWCLHAGCVVGFKTMLWWVNKVPKSGQLLDDLLFIAVILGHPLQNRSSQFSSCSIHGLCRTCGSTPGMLQNIGKQQNTTEKKRNMRNVRTVSVRK